MVVSDPSLSSAAEVSSLAAEDVPAPAQLPVWRYLVRGFGWGLSAIIACLAIAVFVVPAVTGGQRYAIMGSSMEPSMPLGSLVVVRPVDASVIHVGDVITFQLRSGDPAVATHRVVGLGTTLAGERSFTTKGDANAEADDDPVRAVQVRGVVLYVLPLLGYVNTVITAQMQAWALPVVVATLAVYAGWMFLGAWRDHRARRHPDPRTLG